ncbi:glutamyl-tRNA reductase [Massilibacterium senegalense]|uniref:glutamyl-tRNA reductase n=1 Tax=Massilibacterium senegalense TaxID=1632858 RepID=UPI000785B1AA|nr:glutamyl-tRNA reductase [Massilibacterium senegalense]
MHILVVGLNYKTAPVEIREKLSFNESEVVDAVKVLRNKKSILEDVIVSTCNRTEIYAVVDQLHTGRYYIKEFLADWFGLKKEEFEPYLFIREATDAVQHLFRVICGLDSMILGETQIIGQVRDAFLIAQEAQTTGTIFNELFKQAITIAKRSQSETEIGEHAVSVSYAAVELAKKIFGELTNKHVLIVGAGQMGKLTALNLHGSGASQVTVLNRTVERAEELAKDFNGVARSMQQLEESLIEGDILISSTGAKDYVITKEMVQAIIRKRKGRPLLMIDIAVPRDLDPSIDELESVFLYDIDDLQDIVEANIEERRRHAEKIDMMILDEIDIFNEWLNMLGVVPVISALRKKALSIQAETMKSIERKMPDLTDREKKVLSKHTKSIINQLLRDPILQAKEMATDKHAEQSLQLFMKIFAIEEEVKQEAKGKGIALAGVENKPAPSMLRS